MNLAETIKETTRKFLLEQGGYLVSQNILSASYLLGTCPHLTEREGIIELSTSDASNSSVAVGMALVKPTIYTIRFNGFLWYNACSILNYAAKSKFLWGQKCHLFVRSMIAENSIGPVASGAFHNMPMSMPGIPTFAPISPKEWSNGWEFFINNDDPVFCSEHRHSYSIDYEMEDIMNENPDVTIFAISISRLNAIKAIQSLKIKCNLAHIVWLKPLQFTDESIQSLSKSKFGLVLDSGHTICGASQSLAYELMLKTGKPVYAMGLDDRSAGFSEASDNVTASPEKIATFIQSKF